MNKFISTITIKNEELVVTINSIGAEIKSVKDKTGKEYIWEGNPDIWEDSAPVLFPIVSRIKAGKYNYQGKEYTLTAHGFAKYSEFAVESKSEDSVTFLLCSNEDTLKMYPFDFEFRVRYTLNKRSLAVDFITTNKTNGDMYYSTGGHEGYKIFGGTENYSIVLDENETLSRYECLPEGGYSEPIECFNNSNELKLDEKYFTVDAIIMLDIKSRGVCLRDDRDGSSINVKFPGFDTLLVWKKPNAPYVCIEPWAGGPEVPWHKMNDFTEKYRIRKLSMDETEKLTHTITF